MPRPRVLLLSAYDALSHRQWREGLVAALPDIDWTVLTLPARYFNWRIRGNSLSWSQQHQDALTRRYDFLLATSMVDLATLRGLVPALGRIPAIVYFHENQFAYPESGQAQACLEPKMVQLYSALAAEQLVFNSEYNRKTFLSGVETLLGDMPDAVPAGIADRLAAKSRVLPVPLADALFEQQAVRRSGPLTLVWNHRWEYDKAPEIFFAALEKLQQRKQPFRVHVIGQSFRRIPPLFEKMRQQLGEQLVQWGRVESRGAYLRLLRESHVVVSSAIHDFQGLAVLEAVACGCVPVVPQRLAYPEWFDRPFCYGPDAGEEAEILANRLQALAVMWQGGQFPVAPDVSALAWRNLLPRYRALFARR